MGRDGARDAGRVPGAETYDICAMSRRVSAHRKHTHDADDLLIALGVRPLCLQPLREVEVAERLIDSLSPKDVLQETHDAVRSMCKVCKVI